ncbi:hypothetical protein N431DRAFT_531692 [Stipitochalara longipes BDJ]|nr:hypothetical protein N431DRAFT_531692 [Stipitochalara longipes BDJ]
MGKESGKGVGKRLRDLLSSHITQKSEQIYARMSDKIRKILNKEKHDHFTKLSMEGHALEKSFKDAVKQPGWQNEISCPSKKHEDSEDSENSGSDRENGSDDNEDDDGDDENMKDGESDGGKEDPAARN